LLKRSYQASLLTFLRPGLYVLTAQALLASILRTNDVKIHTKAQAGISNILGRENIITPPTAPISDCKGSMNLLSKTTQTSHNPLKIVTMVVIDWIFYQILSRARRVPI
jgi:hypothetical protein